MRTNKVTGVQFCSSREELAKKYFNMFGDGISGVYAKGNMGIVTLLSDAQHVINDAYWIEILNHIKCVLIEDDRQGEENPKQKTRPMTTSEAFGTVVMFGSEEKLVVVGSDTQCFICKDLRSGKEKFINFDCVDQWTVHTEEKIQLGQTKEVENEKSH